MKLKKRLKKELKAIKRSLGYNNPYINRDYYEAQIDLLNKVLKPSKRTEVKGFARKW